MRKLKIGASVRLDAHFDTHIGRMAADTPGEVIALQKDRALVRVAAGDIWIDAERLLPAQRTLEEPES